MRTHLRLMVAMCMTAFLSSFMGSSLNIAMPYVAQDFSCSPESVVWMINAFTAASASFLLAASALADRFGYLNNCLIGIFLSGILSIGVALSPEILSASIIRGLQGVTMSMVFCTSMALISQRIPREHRSFAIGYYVASVYSGLTFSPIISGLIVGSIGWESMFYLTALGMFIACYLIKNEYRDKPITTSLPLGRMILSFILGMVILLSLSAYTSDNLFAWILGLGLVALVISLIGEYKTSTPLLQVKFILQNHVLKYALLASLFQYLGSFVFTLLIAMHLQLIWGYSAEMTGFVLLVQPLLMVIISTLSGKLSHMIGPQYLTITGMVLCIAGILTLFNLNAHSSLSLIFTAQALLGIGFGLFSAPNTVIVMSSVAPQHFAMTSAVQSISRTVGQASSMAALTAALHYCIKAPQGSPAYTGELIEGIHLSLMISAIAYVLGLIFCFFCLKNRIIVVRARKAAEAAAAHVATASAAAAASATASGENAASKNAAGDSADAALAPAATYPATNTASLNTDNEAAEPPHEIAVAITTDAMIVRDPHNPEPAPNSSQDKA